MQKLLFLLLLLCATSAFAQRKKPKTNYLSNTKSAAEIRQIDNKLERLYYSFAGEFSSVKQADTASNPALAVPQQMILVPIWPERKGEYWLYVGWFKHGSPEKALAQGFFKLTKENRDTFILKHFILMDEVSNNYSLEWKKAKPFENLRPKDLVSPQGCTNVITIKDNETFFILPDDDYCQRYFSEQIRSFNFQGELSPNIMRLTTTFYDKDKNLTLDYHSAGGLELIRVDKDNPTYAQPEKKQVKGKKN